MILYSDTSALFKLLVNELGADVVARAFDTAEIVACVEIGYVELRAALAAAIRARRIQATMRDAAVARLDRLWNMVSSVAVEAALIRFAGDLSERHALRGYDAVHLAALIGTGPPGTVSLCCWDSNLRMAAGQLGYALIPTSL